MSATAAMDLALVEARSLALFGILCDNTVAHTLLFLDFETAVRFSKTTSKALVRRFLQGHDDATDQSSYRHVWRSIFARHHFSPAAETVDYLAECKIRRTLLRNLVHGRRKHKACFNLPNRFFYFVPVTPEDNEDDMEWEDPPPVDYDCDSFLLTSTGTSGEMVFLDPFNRSLTVQAHCVDNAVASDEGMMDQCMRDAASLIRRKDKLGLHDVLEEEIAGAVIDEGVYRNHNMDEYRTLPSQVLLDAEDYFSINLSDYFKFTSLKSARRRERDVIVLHEDDEVDIGYLGIDSRPILNDKNEASGGTMIGAARCLWTDSENDQEELGCTELITWSRREHEDRFADKKVCRFAYDFRTLENCSKHSRVYVAFFPGQGPFTSGLAAAERDSMIERCGRRTLVVYPLVPFVAESPTTDDSEAAKAPSYFPKPLFYMRCNHGVTHIVVDGTGETLLAGTEGGNIEIWKTSEKHAANREAILNVKSSTLESAKWFHAQQQSEGAQIIIAAQAGTTNGVSGALVSDDDASSVRDNSESDSDRMVFESDSTLVGEPADDWLPTLFGSQMVDSIHYPTHLSFDICGFVSLHHHRGHGTSLILWKHNKSFEASNGKESPYQVVSQINLPLSSQRKPRVHYDGRRIIVLGQDHIGLIVLVYHVLSSWEDLGHFKSDKAGGRCNGDESGGVYNYTLPHQVRFANRIRHAGLGGLDYWDSIHMTCNERFVIVNTKTGNLLGGGSSPTGEGLLMIDLLDQHE